MTSLSMQRPSRNLFPRWMLIFALSALLAACGFHLRGSANLPFNSIYLGSATGTPLGVELKRNIQAGGKTVVLPKADGAEAIMDVISQKQEKTILTLNSQGQVREYMLYYRFTFRLLDAQKKVLMPETQITLKRDISYSQSEELSKVAEEALLYRDMQSDLVQQILRRFAAIKPSTTTDTAPAISPETNKDSTPDTSGTLATPNVPGTTQPTPAK